MEQRTSIESSFGVDGLMRCSSCGLIFVSHNNFASTADKSMCLNCIEVAASTTDNIIGFLGSGHQNSVPRLSGGTTRNCSSNLPLPHSILQPHSQQPDNISVTASSASTSSSAFELLISALSSNFAPEPTALANASRDESSANFDWLNQSVTRPSATSAADLYGAVNNAPVYGMSSSKLGFVDFRNQNQGPIVTKQIECFETTPTCSSQQFLNLFQPSAFVSTASSVLPSTEQPESFRKEIETPQ